jgi:hypothetical protein
VSVQPARQTIGAPAELFSYDINSLRMGPGFAEEDRTHERKHLSARRQFMEIFSIDISG